MKVNMHHNVSLAEHTRIKIGGIAHYLAVVSSQEELVELQRYCQDKRLNLIILGEGSNVFFADSGFRGVVALIKFDKITKTSETSLRAEAGASLAALNEYCIMNRLTGFEFSTGIPGTVGGAIYGNAGAYGKAVGENIIRAKILTPQGDVKWVDPDFFGFAYRYSRLKVNHAILLEAEFKFEKGDAKKIQEQVDQIVSLRRQKLPPDEIPSAGSYFKNLKDEHGNPIAAAKYLDEIGAKSISVGDAGVYHKHANIIINKGNATAKDVLALEKILREKVYQRFTVKLEREVIYIE